MQTWQTADCHLLHAFENASCLFSALLETSMQTRSSALIILGQEQKEGKSAIQTTSILKES